MIQEIERLAMSPPTAVHARTRTSGPQPEASPATSSRSSFPSSPLDLPSRPPRSRSFASLGTLSAALQAFPPASPWLIRKGCSPPRPQISSSVARASLLAANSGTTPLTGPRQFHQTTTLLLTKKWMAPTDWKTVSLIASRPTPHPNSPAICDLCPRSV